MFSPMREREWVSEWVSDFWLICRITCQYAIAKYVCMWQWLSWAKWTNECNYEKRVQKPTHCFSNIVSVLMDLSVDNLYTSCMFFTWYQYDDKLLVVSSHFEDVIIQPCCSLYIMVSLIWTCSLHLKHTYKGDLDKVALSTSICWMKCNKLSKWNLVIW